MERLAKARAGLGELARTDEQDDDDQDDDEVDRGEVGKHG